jgi:hypothetical protein
VEYQDVCEEVLDWLHFVIDKVDINYKMTETGLSLDA